MEAIPIIFITTFFTGFGLWAGFWMGYKSRSSEVNELKKHLDEVYSIR